MSDNGDGQIAGRIGPGGRMPIRADEPGSAGREAAELIRRGDPGAAVLRVVAAMKEQRAQEAEGRASSKES